MNVSGAGTNCAEPTAEDQNASEASGVTERED